MTLKIIRSHFGSRLTPAGGGGKPWAIWPPPFWFKPRGGRPPARAARGCVWRWRFDGVAASASQWKHRLVGPRVGGPRWWKSSIVCLDGCMVGDVCVVAQDRGLRTGGSGGHVRYVATGRCPIRLVHPPRDGAVWAPPGYGVPSVSDGTWCSSFSQAWSGGRCW